MPKLLPVLLTVKSPLPVMAETDVAGMVISTGLNVPRPALFAVAPVKPTVPKLVSGRSPPLAVQQGSSVMTSAEDRAAPATVASIVCVQPAVLSASVSRNWSLPR
jgi:hypothetical protein